MIINNFTYVRNDEYRYNENSQETCVDGKCKLRVYRNGWTRSPKGDKRKWRFARLVLQRIANDEESVRRMKASEGWREARSSSGHRRYSRRTSILLEHLSTWNLISFVHRRLFTSCRILSLLFSIHSVYVLHHHFSSSNIQFETLFLFPLRFLLLTLAHKN